MLPRKYFLLIVILLVASCKSQKSSGINNDNLDDLIVKKLGTNTNKTKNFNGNYILAWAEDNTSGTRLIRYCVWELEKGELIYAGTALRGNVKWLDNTTLLVEELPGIVDSEQQNYKFKIDLNTRVKVPLIEIKHE